MSSPESWTLGRLLEWTTKFLAEKEAESPRLDAEVLLAEARGCKRIELYTAWDVEADERVRTAFRELVRRRSEGEPVAYLVGRKEFYSLDFHVNEHVLIPRPETEFLVVRLLDLVKAAAASGSKAPEVSIADIGTGSGVLAVCAAKHVPQSRVAAVDISEGALAVASYNAQQHGVAERVEFVQSDLFSAVPAERRFDFILSNPPYITTAEMEDLPATVRNFEPMAALHGGDDGLDVIRPLITQSAERLKPGGHLLFEISPMLRDAVSALVAGDSCWQPPKFIPDLAGLPRVVELRK